MINVEYKAIRSGKGLGKTTALGEMVRLSVCAIRSRFADRYEPARHYMRGIGPKTLARQAKVNDPGSAP